MTTTPDAQTRHAIVIGGGLAGLASAAELLSLGWRVTLLERNGHLGGKMNVATLRTERGDFHFDMGPTILTLPAVLRGIIRRSGKRVEDYIDLIRLDPQWRCFYEDGVRIDLREDPAAMARAMDEQFPGRGVGKGWLAFVEHSRRMFGLSEKVFFYKDLGQVSDLAFNPPKDRDPGLLGDVLAMRMHSTVGRTVHKHIPEPHLAQLAEHFLQYVGSSPFMAPAILTLIASAQVDQGCWYSMAPDGESGGTRCVARALERLVREAADEGRAEVLTGTSVGRIIVEDGRAVGVAIEGGEEVRADAVVSNCDIQRTYRDLLGDPKAVSEQRRIGGKYTPACSGVVFYFALGRQYEHLAHHDFLFSGSSKAEFEDIYVKGVPAKDPTIYLAAPSRTDPTQAPAGCEALYALIHTPYVRGDQQWGEPGSGGILDQYRPVVIDKLKRCGNMPDLEQHILAESCLTPNMIDRMYNAEGGAIYGLASHGRLKGGFKPRNRSKIMRGLYFAGGSANPGPGVPMVLMSGVTAARAASEDAGVPTDDADYSAVNTREDELAGGAGSSASGERELAAAGA